MKLPELKIRNKLIRIPILQGGMAIRVSTGALAGAVAATGAAGIIGASGMELDELRREIRLAKSKAMGGIVGVNIMFVAREFVDLVRTAIEEKIDFIATGAGFSRDIYKLAEGSDTAIIPIVSSGRLAKMAEGLGADAIIVESGEAGGHLGTDRPTRELLPEILQAVKKVPVIAAGGITTGADIAEILKMGASGVQIATRFILAQECNVAKAYQEVYQRATKEDVVLIKSPVGMPGRAIKTAFVEKLLAKNAPKPVGCDFCLKQCSLEYCIIMALINAQKGRVDDGVVFSGANVWKIKDRSIRPAAEIIKELVTEAEAVY